MKSALGALDDPAAIPFLARRCPLVATIRICPSLSSHNTPLRIGRLSSDETANEVFLINP